jgi:hypothetical protein
MNFFALNSNTVYCSIIFENGTESTTFIKFIYKVNKKWTSRGLKPDLCQTHQHKTDRLTPDSRHFQTPPDPTIGTTTASFAFLANRGATVRT